MGPDQGLYAYVGERIRHGELAYRDAWDQKPPGIHYVYAALRALSPRDVVVPAADLAAAALVAALLWVIGTRARRSAGGRARRLCCSCCSRIRASRATAASGSERRRRRSSRSRSRRRCAARACRRSVPAASGARGAALRVLGGGVLLGAAFSLEVQRRSLRLVVLAALALGADEPGYIGWRRFWRGRWSLPGSGDRSGGAARWCSGAAARSTISTRRPSSTTCSIPVRPTASRWDMVRYLFVARSGMRRSTRCGSSAASAALLLIVCVRALAQRRRSLLDSGRVGRARVRVDRDQRQPQPAAVLPPGGAGARARRRGGGGDRRIPRLPRVGAVGRRRCCSPSRPGASAPIPFPSSPATSGTTRSTRSAGSIAARTWRGMAVRATSDKYSALDNVDLGDFLASHTAPDETVYMFGLLVGAYVYARPAQRLALLLEPAGDRRLQRRRTRLRRRPGLRADLGSAEAGARRPAGCATGAGRAGLGAVLPLAATRWRPGCAPTITRFAAIDGFQAGSGTAADSAMTRHRGSSRRSSRSLLRSAIAPARALSRRRSPLAVAPSASSGTTKARGSTTRATRRSSAPGGRTSGTRSTSRRSSRRSSTPRSRRSASASGRRGWSARSRACCRCSCWRSACAGSPGDRPGSIAGALLATNYVYVMYNRAAIMEALMAAFIVASWYCSTRAETVAARGARSRA